MISYPSLIEVLTFVASPKQAVHGDEVYTWSKKVLLVRRLFVVANCCFCLVFVSTHQDVENPSSNDLQETPSNSRG